MRKSSAINLLFLLGFVFFGYGQKTNLVQNNEDEIEGLVIYPNPVTDGKLYIKTTLNLPKLIEIYNVMGKRVKAASIRTKELDISRLSPGLYVLRITENQKSVTKKFVIR